MENVLGQLCDQCISYRANTNDPILHFMLTSNYDKCLDVLLEAGADDTSDAPSRNGYVRGVKSLLETGAEERDRKTNNETALIVAGFVGHDKCVELLLNAGADVNTLTFSVNEHFTLKHFTALHAAVMSRNAKCVELLLKAGADVNKEGYESSFEMRWFTALSLATRAAFDEAAELLIEAGADVNKMPKNGITPLMETLQHYEGDANKHRGRCIELLLEAGADVNAEEG